MTAGRIAFSSLLLVIVASVFVFLPTPNVLKRQPASKEAERVARQSISFEENRGQVDSRVKFLARAPSYTLFLADEEAVFAIPRRSAASVLHADQASLVRMKLEGSTAHPAIHGSEKLP